MKIYIGCKGEYGESRNPICVGFDKLEVETELLKQPVHFNGWVQVDANNWESGCDLLVIHEFDIPLADVMKAIPKTTANVKKFLSLVSRRIYYKLFRS